MDDVHSQSRTATDEFRKALQGGESVRIEDYWKPGESQTEAIFAQLLAVEVAERSARGEVPTIEDYLTRFPQFQAIIQRHFTSTDSNSMMSASTVMHYESMPPRSQNDVHSVHFDLSVGSSASAESSQSIRDALGLSKVSSADHRQATRVDQLCDEFEGEWAAGRRPEIGQFLDQVPLSDKSALFRELVALDWEYRQKNQEQPAVREYVAKYPAFADLLTISDIPYSSSSGSASKSGVAEAGSTEAPGANSTITTLSGRYRLEKLVGRGGFAEVWQAQDTVLNRPVAVKRPRPDLPQKHAAFASFLQEARRVAGLQFPGVVPVYDVCDEAGRCCIVSQFIDGEPLDTRMKRSLVPLGETVEIVAQVAETLHRAHLQDIVHRDIKPGNILLNKAGKPFVADFGLATSEVEQLDERKAVLGTCLYMSPEQARGDANRVDGRSDIYSVGVVLYHLLTGSLPFMAKTQAEYIDQILHREPRPPRARLDTIPPELERICLKCMEKHPGQRYTTALDLATDLRKWQQPQAVIVKTPARWPLMTALVATAAVLILLAIFAFNRKSGPPTTAEVWERVLHGKPYEKSLPNISPDGFAGFREDLQAYEISSGKIRMVALSNLTEPAMKLEIKLSQPTWQGGAGIFYGYHEEVVDGRNVPVFEAIWTEDYRAPRQQPEFRLYRGTCIIDPAHGWLMKQPRGFHKIPRPHAGDECLLQFQINGNQLTSVFWNRKAMPNITSASSNTGLLPNAHMGDWGIWQQSGSGTTHFKNPSVETLSVTSRPK